MSSKEPAFGNQEVIALLETWLLEARKGELNYAALAVCKLPNIAAFDFVGTQEMEPVVDEALKKLQDRMERFRCNRALPPVDPRLGADHVCYNLAAYPVSYDFFTWLVDAEMTRRREGAPAPLKVTFYRGIDGKTGLESARRQQMFEGVVKPTLALLGAVEEKEQGGRSKPYQLLRDVVQAVKRGEQVPLISVPGKSSRAGAVTITLRETSRWLHRNSDLAAWLKFADHLTVRGERVIFVRDTKKANEPLKNQETFPAASRDLAVRAALYEQAKCNMFVGNGPFMLALFGTRPYLSFIKLDPNDSFPPSTPNGWTECQGTLPGEQFPWAKKGQRIVWSADTYQNLCAAWEEQEARQPITA